MLDIDGALKFLALEMALVNTDGYWTRASDYNIYQDVKGRFHVIPHDMNEALINEGGGRGRGAGWTAPDFGSRRPGRASAGRPRPAMARRQAACRRRAWARAAARLRARAAAVRSSTR